MSWKELIQPGPVWSGVQDYVAERTAELAAICTDQNASDRQIRDAQAGIEELKRLNGLPKRAARMNTETAAPRRAEY
jgi:hypothetical protein